MENVLQPPIKFCPEGQKKRKKKWTKLKKDVARSYG